MAAIEGLSAAVCQQLASVQVGDVVMIQAYSKRAAHDDEDGERSESSGGEERDAQDHGEVGENDATEESSASGGDEDQVMDNDHDEEQSVGAAGGDAFVDLTPQIRELQQMQQHSAALLAQLEQNMAMRGFPRQSFTAALASAGGAAMGAVATAFASSEHVHNGGQSGGNGTNAGNGDAVMGNGQHDEEDDDQGSIQSDNSLPPRLFLVIAVTTNKAGHLTDIAIRELHHYLEPATACAGGYHIYGTVFELCTNVTNPNEECKDSASTSIKNLASENDTFDYNIIRNPCGDTITRNCYGSCPAVCDDGFLETVHDLQQLVTDNITDVSPYSPVCPVCIGKDIALAYHQLRVLLERAHVVTPDVTGDVFFSLNPRRTQLGYSFKQYDEREWGLLFDDIASEDDDYDGNGNDGYEHFAEAMDPNANPVFKRASRAAIEALESKSYKDIEDKDRKEVLCAICGDGFTEEGVVTMMPCGHLFCGGEESCLMQWLSTSHSCPICRAKLPVEEETHRDVGVQATDGPAGDGAIPVLDDIVAQQIEYLTGVDPTTVYWGQEATTVDWEASTWPTNM